ncbi:MAG: histidinol dehydrogenase [Kangiellaceae bacterium]
MIVNLRDWMRPQLDQVGDITHSVSNILREIERKGDTAIDYFSQKFDGIKPKEIKLQEFSEYQLEKELADSIELAASRIEKFARFQKKNGSQDALFSDEYGEYGQRVTAIERAGAYIPGGRFPLISTALMTLIPAKVAGCKIRIACSPSDHPAILAAASLAGATKFIQIGGVQAIALLANGYKDDSPVDVIVGPGNAWVNEAKKQLQSKVKIDGLAGPSELVALCDERQPIIWIALDAMAQAEHDPMACSIIVSDSLSWLNSMQAYLVDKKETKGLLQNKQIELVFAKSTNEMIGFSNQYAPEHLMLCHQELKKTSLINYGSLFIGANSAVAIGDYISGPNHTLPTLGYAKQNGGLNVASFQKVACFQNINHLGVSALSNYAMPIAKAEGLTQHYSSLKIRSKR